MKKMLLMIVCVMLLIAPLAGCEYEYDPGVEANLELVYTLVGEGEEAYYVVGKVKTLEEAELNSVSVNALTYEEKAAKLGVYGGCGCRNCKGCPRSHKNCGSKGLAIFVE